jgi:hypothetical protein
MQKRITVATIIEEEQTTQWRKEKSKRTNNNLQNIHITLKNYVTLLKTGVNPGAPKGLNSKTMLQFRNTRCCQWLKIRGWEIVL